MKHAFLLTALSLSTFVFGIAQQHSTAQRRSLRIARLHDILHTQREYNTQDIGSSRVQNDFSLDLPNNHENLTRSSRTFLLSDTFYVVESYLIERWDTNTSTWINSGKYTYTNDSSGHRIEYVYRTWNGTMWVNSRKTTYTYNANGYPVEYLYQAWDGTNWINTWKDSVVYNNNGYPIEYLEQAWSGSTWLNDWRETITYDSNNQPTEYLDQTWNGTTWVNDWKYTLTFASNGSFIEILAQKWNGTIWGNDWKESVTYDSSGYPTEYLDQTWSGTTWINDWQYTLTYDSTGYLIEELLQKWYPTTWVNYQKFTFTYNSDGYRKLQLSQSWNGNEWMNYYRYTWTWQIIILDVKGEYPTQGTFKLYENYPNPFNPATVIQYTVPSNQYVSLKVYNVLGEEIATLVNEVKPAGTYEVTLNASHLSSGLYFYKLQAGSFVETKKLVLLK